MAFLATEGGMIGWAIDYMYQNNIVASNSIEATEALSDLSIIKNGFDNSVYLPNYYQLPSRSINYFKVYFSKLLRWIGFTDKPIKTVLNIGFLSGRIAPKHPIFNTVFIGLSVNPIHL